MTGPRKPKQEPVAEKNASEAKKSPISTLPTDAEEMVYAFSGLKDKRAFVTTHKATQTLFQQQVSAEELLKCVAYGEQKEAEQLIQQVLSRRGSAALLDLLQTKSSVTDCSGRTFEEPKLAAFQYAFWAKDQHMLKMLEPYLANLSKEEPARQLKELGDNKVKYGVVLMTIDAEQKNVNAEALSLRRISSQNMNKPILIKQRESLHRYGYDFLEAAWKLTPLDPKAFKDENKKDLLAFPQSDPFTGLHILPNLDLKNLPVGSNYILIQEAPGVAPSGLYFVDGSGAKLINFPINQNISTFTRALYPAVMDDTYTDLPQLSPEQLLQAILTTGQPLTVADKTTLTEDMYKELAKGHTQGTEHGMHYDFSRLQAAYEIYLENFNFDGWSYEQGSEYWKKMVGGAQDVVPGHVRDEYCRLDRAFYPLPSFDEPTLPRSGRLYNSDPWYSREGSGLSVDFAVLRGGGVGAVLEGRQVGLARGWAPMWDLVAVSRLCEVRTEYVATLTQQLLNPAPSAAPSSS